jgi:hypothetical protein
MRSKVMKTPMTINGTIQFKTTLSEPNAKRFFKLIEEDLEFAKNKGTIKSLKIQNNTIIFSFASISKRFLKYPATRFTVASLYPVNFSEFTRWAANMSSGKILVNQNAELLTISYQLNFSELFRWALFIFTGTMLLGLTALTWERRLGVLSLGAGIVAFIVFGLYFMGGVLSGGLAMRSYLKKRLQQAISENG